MQKPAACIGCVGYNWSDGADFTLNEGTGRVTLAAFGEAPGEWEAEDNRPLSPNGASGKVFRRALRELGIPASAITISNCIRCKIPGNNLRGESYEREALDHCQVHLRRTLEDAKPTVILALGDVPLRELAAERLGTVTAMRGFLLDSKWPGTKLVASYHPSFIARGAWQLFGVFKHDIAFAYRCAVEGLPTPLETHYELNPSVDRVRGYYGYLRDNPVLPISYDVETASILGESEPDNWRAKRIIQIQFSHAVGQAIVLPWDDGEYRDLARPILALPNPKWGWNSRLSDDLCLRASGAVLNGELHDLMNAWGHLNPSFWGGKSDIDTDKGVPSRLMGLQSCTSFYVPEQPPWKSKEIETLDDLKQYGCLSGNSLVLTEDGYQGIGDIVNSRYSGKVVSFDGEGLSLQPITNWYRNKHKELVGWTGVETEHTQKNRWGRGTRYTPDHRLLSQRGWVAVEDLTTDDYIALPQMALSYNQYQVALGSLLGDGSIKQRNPSEWANLSISHSADQKDYLGWKTQLLGPLVSSTRVQLARQRTIMGRQANCQALHTIATYQHPELKNLWIDSYAKERRRFIGNWVDEIDALALAVAYQDNGTLVKPSTARLYLQRFDEASVERLQDHLSKMGICTSRYWANDNAVEGGGYAIHVSAKSSDVFFALIAPFVHPCTAYKIPVKWAGQFVAELPDSNRGLIYSRVTCVKPLPFRTSKGSLRTSYCIDVENTHNFLTQSEVAHNCIDADMTYRCGIGIMASLEAQGLMTGYRTHKLDLRPTLDYLGEIGLPVDRTKQAELRTYVQGELQRLQTEIQALIPPQLTGIHPQSGYKQLSARIHTVGSPEGEKRPLRDLIVEYDSENPPLVEAAKHVGYLVQRDFVVVPATEIPDDGVFMDVQVGMERRWCIQRLFNPHGSSPNTKQFIRHMGYRMPTKIDDPTAETTGKSELKKLADETGDGVLSLIHQWRDLAKTGLDYTGGAWVPGDDGRVHATFKFGTASAQLVATSPAIMTYPEHSEIAKRAKDAIRAEEGRVLVAGDLRGFHARSIGWLANDPVYYRLADYDVHSFVSAHYLHLHDAEYLLDMADDELTIALAQIKEQHKHTRNYRVKRVTLGRQFGLQVRKLYLMNSDNFDPKPEQVIEKVGESKWFDWDRKRQLDEIARRGRREATALFQLFDRLFPRTFVVFPAWVDNQIRNVTKNRLVSPFGHHRMFWDYDLQQATAYLPSNCAHCHVQAALVRLHRRGALREFQAVNFVHDALWLHPRIDQVEECVAVVKEELERPSDVLVNSPLGPFQCSTDFKIGETLESMENYE